MDQDPIAQAAEALSAVGKAGELADQMAAQVAATGAIDPQTYAEAQQAGNAMGNVLVNETPVVAAPVVEAGTADMGESQTSSQAPASPQLSSSAPQSSVSASEQSAAASGSPAIVQDSGEVPNVAPAADAGDQDPVGAAPAAGGDELPRESHLMLLEHKLAAMHAKFKTGERIVIDEFEQILGHIRAVL